MEKSESKPESSEVWLEGFCRRAEERGVTSLDDKNALLDVYIELEKNRPPNPDNQ